MRGARVSIALVGAVRAEGKTTAELETIRGQLRDQELVKDPKVSVEVEPVQSPV